VKNDSSLDKRYYNGKIVEIVSLNEDEIWVQFPEETEPFKLEKESWQNKKFTVNENSMMHLSISTANTSVIEQKYDALMITINFVYSGIFDFNDIVEIIDLAHDNTSLFFKKLLKTDFYGSLV
jgi:hypothetical protein